MAALEEQVRTSGTRQRLLEEKYATVEAELQHTEHELEAKERKWGSKQEEQHEALVKRSQVVWSQCVCLSMCCVSVRVCGGVYVMRSQEGSVVNISLSFLCTKK